MTKVDFYSVIGTIFLAPHLPRAAGIIWGVTYLIVAVYTALQSRKAPEGAEAE